MRNKTFGDLKPFINEYGLLCVGGKLQKSLEYKVSTILPNSSSLSPIITRDCHERVTHGGREETLKKFEIQVFGSSNVMDLAENSFITV